MGIQYLTKIYRPLGDFSNYTSLAGADVFIDGPSLAHRICRDLQFYDMGDTALATQGARRVIQAMLDGGLNIRYIVFDGALPLDKEDTRIERTKQSIDKLSEQPEGLIIASFAADMFREMLDEYYPAIPVITVPYEADFAIAGMIKTYTEEAENKDKMVYVMSSDSDFYVYEMGTNVGCICLSKSEDLALGQQIFVTQHRKLREMIQRPLWEAGYLVETTPINSRKKLNFFSLRNKVMVNKAQRESYEKFKDTFTLKEFTWTSIAAFVNDTRTTLVNDRIPSCKFTRLHEFLNRHYDNIKKEKHNIGIPKAEVYLPTLVEDVTRPSVWIIGSKWRSLTYEMLIEKLEIKESSVPVTNSLIIEYYRVRRGVGATYIPIQDHSRQEGREEIDNPEHYRFITQGELKGWIKSYHNDEGLVMTVKAIVDEIVTYNLDTQPLSETQCNKLTTYLTSILNENSEAVVYSDSDSDSSMMSTKAKRLRDVDWNIASLHLFAQTQAALYSLCFLQQAGVELPHGQKIKITTVSDSIKFSKYFLQKQCKVNR
ncbi:hypothetical protein NADFUDRAFT_80022 [Nadsonia fulvescens var. elongata DSM 6958]|uniref:Asteroid domain-containing protein n=1 Tax=Nadsonia fulvescens var. elongata DSM 6958 TaxID=857566 RepID=A0A1E3PEQ6_9ASCO|nr:hypothetical protein NADFUDRAFT_80022 [Nadsonia fulvescens var. elongata DSM 6958]